MTGVAPVAAECDTEEYRARGWWRSQTFLDDLHRQARLRPHHTALAGVRVREARTDLLTFAELARTSDRFAAALLELGVRAGEVVAFQLPDRWEVAPLIFACLRVGAVICPIATDTPPEELRHRLALTEAAVLVTVDEWDGRATAEAALAVRAGLPLRHIVVCGGAPRPEVADFHELFVARADPTPDQVSGRELGPDEAFVVLFTSGTTGASKGVLHSQNTIYAAVRGYADALGFDTSLVAALTSPLVHYSGFGQGILTGVLLGATIVFQDHRDLAGFPALIERFGATLLYGSPPTIAAVLDAQREHPREVSSLRQVVVGTAPVLDHLVRDVDAVFGARTHSLWGLSEFGPITISRLDYDPGWAARSHGRAIDAVDLRIDARADPDTRAEVGRLRVRGASRALGYLRRDAEFEAAATADGWFDTGDLARADGRGGVRILGRAKDAIVRAEQVAPVAELEALIARHPAIAEAALVGVAGRDGEVVVAVVVTDGAAPVAVEEVRALLRAAEQDSRFLPDRVASVTALPKTLTGKVRKVELRQRYGEPAPTVEVAAPAH
ncbi:AMP-binding protein [Nocardia bovistercoris]|uniref:AMP-binding protein n=1 Tax=Nocardia bovistercoris TaxID=2785916 RepID=A0A931IF55_9NOCA|nr:AMP-binding protein [Nocardia bovistercoris]MBH0779413.1 AMP-binding protein [Nocardia bovistercoris]